MSQSANNGNSSLQNSTDNNKDPGTNTIIKPVAKPATKVTKPKKFQRTFYRRQLPSPPATPFSSDEGKKLFREALAAGTMEGYFALSEQFRTQDEPAFCGISTLTMVLNTLAVDPQRVWKGPWRWYNETMLDCCRSLDEVKQSGIDFDQFACLGRCNSLNMIAKRPNQKHIYPTKDTINPIIQKQIDNDDNKNDNTDQCSHNNDDIFMQNQVKRSYYTLDEFREDVIVSCSMANNPVVIVSYSRKGLKQTGDGHFSPIGGYHKGNDMVLIMDVARFKYPPHWVKIDILYAACCRIDSSCNKTRGWILASNADNLQSYFFSINASNINKDNALDINNNVCSCAMNCSNSINNDCVLCLSNNSNSNSNSNNNLTSLIVIKCLLNCLPSNLNEYISNPSDKFGIKLSDHHEIIKKKLLIGIRDNGIYKIICAIFDDPTNNNNLITKHNANNDINIEIITLMILIIGNDIWKKISNKILSNELCQLTKINKLKHPELHHEVIALQHQISNLRPYLLSMYQQTLTKL